MDITDLITFCLSIFFLVRGASLGFLRSLISPFSIIVTSFFSFLYYQTTQNMMLSLAIGTIGPLLLSFALKIVLNALVPKEEKTKPEFLSRLSGALLTFAWGWVFIIFTILLLALIPPLGNKLTAIHKDITKSLSYAAAQPLEDILFSGSKPVKSGTLPATSKNDAKSLAKDPRFQAIMQDPEIQKDVDSHDIGKLMRNPKVMELTKEIMNDPVMLKKVLDLYKSKDQSSPVPESPQKTQLY